MSRDQLLGRARRAVLAVAGTAGGLGSRAKRRQADKSIPTTRGPTAGLPPRIERTREPGLPPVPPERGPTPALPPRIERDQPGPALPPRIDRSAASVLPPRIEREPPAARPPEPAPEPSASPGTSAGPEPLATPEPSAKPEPPARPEPAPKPGLPPRIEHRPEPARAVAVTDTPQAGYRSVRDPSPGGEAGPAPTAEPTPGQKLQPVPVGPVRPDPLASPVRNVLRSHQRLASILLALVLIGAAGYWVVRIHQRIGEQALEAGVTKQQRAPTVKCAALQSNGSVWACAVVYQAESICLIANVDVLGSWSTNVGQHRCERMPALQQLVPQGVTGTMVAADINRREGQSDFVCGKLPSHKVRWVCERPLRTGGQCLVVRVIPWTAWNVLDGGKTCAHDPALQKALRRS